MEVKLGSVYHALLAGAIAVLVMWGKRSADRWHQALTIALLVYGVVRLIQDSQVFFR